MLRTRWVHLHHHGTFTDNSVDESDRSAEWDTALQQQDLKDGIDGQAVAIKIRAGTPEAGFLTPICPINSTPAVVVIKNATLQANIQGETETPESLTEKLTQLFGGSVSSQTGAPNITMPPQSPSDESVQPADSTASASSGAGYIDLPSSAGQPRLPNNAYDALREFTEGLKEQGMTPNKILEAQLSVLNRLPIFKDEVQRLRSQSPNDAIELSQSARDRLMLRLPAAAIKAQMKVQSSTSTPNSSTSTSTPPSAPPASDRVYPPRPPQPAPPPSNTPSTARQPSTPAEPPQLSAAQLQQQSEYRQMQRDRETKAREERERIKQQIKADKEERRRPEQVQKQNDLAASTTTNTTTTSSSTSTSVPKPNPNELRVQVRTFDGSLLRSVFTPTSTIAADLRPWIDGEVSPNVPYDFKLILTPLPNRKIEAGEEALGLRDLGVRGSCTFVIAPVKGYVESYAGGGGGGLVGSVVSGGYNLVAGTVGGLLGGVGSLLGYGGGGGQQQQGGAGAQGPGQQVGSGGEGEGAAQQQRSMRVRTLADQRAEEQRGNQFYNGNALNFQPNKDDERKKD